MSWAKNSALPILATAVVTGKRSLIRNCPQISDAERMCDILKMFGCRVAALAASGIGGTVREEIFESRFGYIKELNKMYAGIEIDGKNAIISKRSFLIGGELRAEDLRGGAALVTAALAAEGKSVVHGVKYIKRGYSSFAKKLRALGADIEEKND